MKVKESVAALAVSLNAIAHQMVGSTYALGEGKDEDYLILVPSRQAAFDRLIADGWEHESEYAELDEDDDFTSLRSGRDNLIVTADPEFYCNFVTAAEVCRLLQIADRDTRVQVHQIIMYEKTADQVR